MPRKSYSLIPFLAVSSLFLMWGLANNMNDTLLAAFKRILSISDLQSSLVQFAFYGAYFCFAIPAALYIQRFSYKSGILLGLAIYATGTILFYPAGLVASYPFFLIAIYVMAGGCAILETSANPYILSMGDEKSATRRLNIAQTFNPVGALGGILLSRYFILSSLHEADASERASMSEEALKKIQHAEFNSVSETYLIIGAILICLLVFIWLLKMPGDSRDTACHVAQQEARTINDDGFLKTFRRLAKNTRYLQGVIAQFFYVGAQTCVWSFTIRYVMAAKDWRESEASLIFLWSIIAFTACRFIFTWLMKYFSPAKLMTWCSVGAICATAVVIFVHGNIAIIALVLISACMSLMFPTIYAISLENVVPPDRKVGASGLIMAILGGALLTPLQGLFSDSFGISPSFFVTLFCFAVVLSYSLSNIKKYHKPDKTFYSSLFTHEIR